MICGGKVDIYLEAVNPQNVKLNDLYKEVVSIQQEMGKGFLATLLFPGLCYGLRWDLKALFKADGSVTGTVLDHDLTSRIQAAWNGEELKAKPQTKELQHHGENLSLYIEPIGNYDTVYLMGAGHISRKLAPLLKEVDFRVVVVDDRFQFANKESFPSVDELAVLPFEKVLKTLEVGYGDYVVIVTRGHLYDHILLEQVINLPVAYIGMIGSHRKRDMIYRDLRGKGITEDALAQVHSPIGLAIHAETPDEIAISIAAELIKVRGERQKKKTVIVS
jgi:xanthine dehydrogenase accessory factor